MRGAGASASDMSREAMNPGVGWRPGMSPRPLNPPPRPEKPVIRVELKPASAGPTTPAREDSGDPTPAWGSNLLGGGTVRVPVNAIYIASALLIALAFLGWLLGWQMGTAQRQPGQEPTQRPSIMEPTENPPVIAPPPTRSVPDTSPKKASDPAKSNQLPPRTVPSSSAPITITGKGLLQGDPREVDRNYLKLAQMTRTEAERAVKFLCENGLDAFAVPVDKVGSNTNNPDPSTAAYWLIAAKGITSEEYSNRLTARTNIEAAVARLGQRWQKEFKGSSNFSKPAWEKFK